MKAHSHLCTLHTVSKSTMIRQNGAMTNSIHVETNDISCYLFINSSLNSALLFGVWVCVFVHVFTYDCV